MSSASNAKAGSRSSTSVSGLMPSARVILFASGWPCGMLGRERAAIDHLLDDRVVLGELPDLTRAHEVHAAVADVRDLGAPRVHQHRHARRTRTARLAARLRPSGRRGAPLARSRLAAPAPGGVPGGAPSTICTIVRTRELAGLLAGRVSAHAVAHDEQVPEARLLVARTRLR